MKKITLILMACLCIGTALGQTVVQKKQPKAAEQKYTLEQALSDKAQLNTIAFGGLAFLTGNFGYDTFLPPGKVSDYFGFQYMRDIDAGGKGHNTWFLTAIASNMLSILDDEQKSKLVALAEAQEANNQRFAEMRFPLIQAFRRNLIGDVPVGNEGLDREAVMHYSSELYELDGLLAYQRAKVMGEVIQSLSNEQREALDKLEFGNSASWPQIPEQQNKLKLKRSLNVAVMTYASEMFAWYAGSLEADTYFCPERHGMYFGGFGMKTAPAMGKKDYGISTSLTGDSGEDFLALLDDDQRKAVTDIIDLQRNQLHEIVELRRNISAELRKFQFGEVADQNKVLEWSRRYGELDGEMSYFYASAFARVGQTLSETQQARLSAMRHDDPEAPTGPFLYSRPVSDLQIGDTNFLFGAAE